MQFYSVSVLSAISSSPSADTEEVKMISIDEFTKENGIKHVDLLKIDAEGNDNKVSKPRRMCLLPIYVPQPSAYAYP